MKSDIDRLMAARRLDALIVLGGEGENPHRAYLTNGAEASATVFKLRGEPARLLTGVMEVEEAKKSGLEVTTTSDLKLYEIWKEYAADPDMMTVKMFERYFDHFGFTGGRIGVYGFGDLGSTWEQLKLLEAHFPGYTFVGERRNTIFDEAVTTKDAAEIKAIKEVGQRTNLVMQTVWDFVASHRAEGDTVVKADGEPLTIGDVKRFLRVKLLEYDLVDNGSTIFAQGRDGGFPHSRGEAEQALKLGQAIVFDLFPRDIQSGYYHDMTRTWSIGYATPEVQRAYEQVLATFTAVMESLKVGERTKKYQELTLDMLEEFGHPTSRTDPGTTIGYMHGLGHGLGLQIHERPSFTHMRDDDAVQVGNVFTIEPGVYYPDQGYGIRIEDTAYVAEDGTVHSLTPMSKDLVLKLQG
ncbi:MAG: aminopeptidase P family protein [Anaerolineae bacterium]|nr:aminopeptidase P family protein [Anaerolineae bacterium]